MLGTWLGKLKGKDRLDTIENWTILLIAFGALMLSVGIGLSAINTRGISAILAMSGSLLAFLSTVALIFAWLVKEFKGE